MARLKRITCRFHSCQATVTDERMMTSTNVRTTKTTTCMWIKTLATFACGRRARNDKMKLLKGKCQMSAQAVDGR